MRFENLTEWEQTLFERLQDLNIGFVHNVAFSSKQCGNIEGALAYLLGVQDTLSGINDPRYKEVLEIRNVLRVQWRQQKQ